MKQKIEAINHKINEILIDIESASYIEHVELLYHAVKFQNLEMIFLLLELGINPFEKFQNEKKSPFELACSMNSYEIISLFSNFYISSSIH